MQYIKKISILLLIWFVICSMGISAQTIKPKNIESYTFEYYVSFLNSVLVPEIEKHVLNFNILPYDKETGRILISGVIKIIQKHADSFNIIVPPGKQYPVSLIIIPPDSQGLSIFYVNVIIPLLEYDDNAKIASVLMISKNFFCVKIELPKKEKL